MKLAKAATVALLAALAACAPTPPAPDEGVALPAEFPAAYYRQAEAEGREVLRIDPARSLVAIEVHRAGTLARLGHDHVVASRDMQGFVAPSEDRADLHVPLERLTVDEPELRAEAKLDTRPSEAAIDATRRNMLEKVLETGRFPHALIRVSRAAAGEALKLAVTLHGATRSLEVPASFETLPDGMAVSGRLSLKQSDFGIVPMSVLGGALQVADAVDLRFRIVAVRPAAAGR